MLRVDPEGLLTRQTRPELLVELPGTALLLYNLSGGKL